MNPDGKPNIQFVDLAAQQARIRDKVEAAMMRTLDHGRYIMGPEIGEFEAALSEFCGAKHAIGVSSGTDALALVLMAKGVRPGQAVFCPAFTFVATAEVVAWLGAHIWFVDVEEDTFNMDPVSLERAIAQAKEAGHEPVGIMPVDLFGLPAKHHEIATIARREGLFILDDAAQGFGASINGEMLGTFGDATGTSFFPAKPLGGYGDSGAVFTNDDDLADTVRSLLFHGKGSNQYDNVRVGMTGRMDSLQAGILIEKLAIFEDEIAARNRVAERYSAALSGVLDVPTIPDGLTSIWAQYTLKTRNQLREPMIERIRAKGVPVAVYYTTGLHKQPAYVQHNIEGGSLPTTDRLCQQVFSLPMHPYLDEATQDYIIETVLAETN